VRHGRNGIVRHGLWLLLACMAISFAQGIDEFEGFDDPALQERYSAIIREVRCLTCLNRSIAESETPLAADLRREIRELIAGGATDEEVVRFLTDRYGDFVMYRPPVKPTTWALWGAPVFFLAIGALAFGRILIVRMRQPIEDDEAVGEGKEA
jgi:cytochrome c-type biogenesis protein CcmH